MKKLLFLFLVLPFVSYSSDSTQHSLKGYGYVSWGYNRSFFTDSDIEFNSNHYNFILRDVKASDRPSVFSLSNYFAPENISIPQYCFRFGYYLTDQIQISVGMDHMKYVVDQNQKVVIDGSISSTSNTNYNGVYNNQEIEINKDFLQFEHTNGLNLVSIQCDYGIDITRFFNNKFALKWNAGIGGIWVGTKSDVRIIDEGIDNDHHLAGYCLTAQTGPRLFYKKILFFDVQTKVGYMNLSDVFIENQEANKRANHSFSFLSYYGSLGVLIPVNKLLKK